MLQLTLPSKLPSGRSFEDIRVTTERTSFGTYLIMSVKSQWCLIYKSNDGRYYVMVDNAKSRESVSEMLRQYRIKQTECYINKLKRMVQDYEM